MKTLIAFIIFLFNAIICVSQGINFEKGNWEETIAKAKQEKKLIYLDIFTSWCGPCKMMAKKYFPDEKVAEVYNRDFVNMSIDAEKGEGITLAAKYHVSGYPTNLFIDPQNAEIIYKTTGMPADKEGFINNGVVAISERNDPMKLPEYQKIFVKNSYDEKFLRKYIDKAKRLDLSTDLLLDAFITKYSKGYVVDSNVLYLKGIVNSINNKGFDYIIQHADLSEDKNANKDFAESMMFRAIHYASLTKKTPYFQQAVKKYEKLFPNEVEKSLFYQKDYYSKVEDNTNLWPVYEKYADLLNGKSSSLFETEDKELLEEAKEGLVWQMDEMKIPVEKRQEAIDKTINANPILKYQSSNQAGTDLNQIAWEVFEKKRTNKALLSKALVWSEKAMELSKKNSINEQLVIKDTYATLLYANGKKEKAIELEKEIVRMAKEEKSEDIASFEETLQKMQDGTY